MPDAMTHPTTQELAAFGLGKLPERAAAAVAAHLQSCAACRNAVACVSADSFLGKIRAAGQHGSPLPPSAIGPDKAPNSPNQPAIPVVHCSDVPPELVRHPKYLILRELGRGGMGVIYQARHREMDRQIVIKVINRALLERPGAVERFRREVQAAAQLSHPNIVTAYDAEQAGEMHMLVMEFVPGQSLAEVLEKKGPLSVANACHYMRQVALGLQHAHEHHMVHRDIKPNNLILMPKGQVKILDFGLAKVISERGTGTGLTSSDSFMGTPDYCAPEQATDARTADIRADLYSLGCTLYCLLAGRPPFHEDTPIKTILAHMQKEPQPLPALRLDVSAALWQVVAKLLAKEPAQRYQKPVEVFRALSAFVKPGAEPEAKSGSLRAPVVSSPGKGTKIAEDTRQIKNELQKVVSKQPPRKVPAKAEAASPFENLEDRYTLPKQTKGASESRKRAQARWYRRWYVLASVGLLLLALLGMWASGVFVKTKYGTIVLENLPLDAEVWVDGETITLKAGDGKTITITAGKKHRLQVKKEGFKVFGEEVEIDAGERRPIRVTLQPEPPLIKPPPSPPKTPQSDNAQFQVPDQPAKGARKLFKAKRNSKGKWIIVDNHVEQTSFDDNVCLYFGDPAWKDYDFAVDVMKAEGNDQVCQLFRRKEGEGAFFYGMNTARESHLATIEKQRPGSNQALGSRKGHLDQGKWYRMVVSVRGKHMRCFLNDSKLFDFETDEHPSGCVGLRTYWTQ